MIIHTKPFYHSSKKKKKKHRVTHKRNRAEIFDKNVTLCLVPITFVELVKRNNCFPATVS